MACYLAKLSKAILKQTDKIHLASPFIIRSLLQTVNQGLAQRSKETVNTLLDSITEMLTGTPSVCFYGLDISLLRLLNYYQSLEDQVINTGPPLLAAAFYCGTSKWVK